MRTHCWRCQAATVVVVGLRVRGCSELIPFDEPLVKRIVQALMSDELPQRMGVSARRNGASVEPSARHTSRTGACSGRPAGRLHDPAGGTGFLLDADEQRKAFVVLMETAIPSAIAKSVIKEFWG